MTESNDPTASTPDPTPEQAPEQTPDPAAAPPPYAAAPPPATPAPAAPMAPMGGMPDGPVGQVRSTGTCILLSIVTLGFYTWYWWYKTHDELKRHTGAGLGGGVALILAIFVSVVMPFFTSDEVGKLYERKGQPKPVTAVTGLWYLLLGWFFLVGAIVWFVKTNRALNDYWRSQGAQG
ncbi:MULTISPECIES: DUF4234 domain-containing protein [unclassified Nocardioides]|uniref:DUF4234 domain-containing protein n=1 Tax=unclassified Nocardioides TaxID=2615069 RepID=UPI00361802BE